MKVEARLNNLRIAPRKIRMLADIIRRKSVVEARATLKNVVKRGSDPILKLLEQAVSNAKHNYSLSDSNLYISKIVVDEGPKLKRIMPRSRGQAYEIQKKTSHILMELNEIEKGKGIVKEEKKEEMEKEEKKTEVKKEEKKSRFGEIKEDKKLKAVKKGKSMGLNRIFRRKAF